ncbi:TonB-dependent receptor plug domain-containing protein [Janthinobacterium rivuli]|uniref:TonB-dependent receptor n=1 Tax=Janthinobacterium rivuli TaxID=2751478 RepID=UPI00383AC3B6
MLRKTVLVRALALAFSAGAMSTMVVAPVMAQSNASGTIYGTVDAPAGTSVALHNLDTGLKRTASVESNGRYTATALPIGHYKIDLVRDGKVVESKEVDIVIGQGVDASFNSKVQAVQVTGRRSRIDVSNTNNGAVFTAKELAALPIAQNVGAIIQLAPNTTRADSRYAGGASFGGGGASENAYYINGMVVTNALTQLGSSELPFGAIAQAQVLTGGYGAEFGRSVGGVVNITTKSGTNNWEVGGQMSITPNGARAKARNGYYPITGDAVNAGTDGKILFNREYNKTDSKQFSGYVGGPIIKDKLFMFIAAETTRTDRDYINLASSNTAAPTTGWGESKAKVDRYLGKFDWNISDNHRLELTLIGDTPKTDVKLSGFDYKNNSRNGVVASREHYSNIAAIDGGNGGEAQVLKYTGNITDDFTVSALYGINTSKHSNTYDGYDINTKLFQVQAPLAARADGVTYNSKQPLINFIGPPGAKDKTKSLRLDLEYKLGSHTLRAGLDQNKLESINAGEFRAGGGLYIYRFTKTPNTPINLGDQKKAVSSGGGLGTKGYYGSEHILNTVTNAYSDQDAQYIEDLWQVNKDVLVTIGLRNEGFTNKNGENVKFMEMKNQIAPRLSASWDVNGDATLKVFGSAGRYHLQIPTHLAVRGASRSLNTTQYFTYTDVDANGAPIGRVNLTDPYSSNNEYFQPKDAKTLSATNLRPTYQDELTIGFEKAFSPSLNFGAKATYRTLGATIDDFCDGRPVAAWAARNKIDTSNYGGFGCANFNPGEANTFLVDFAGNGKYTKVNLSKEDLGFDKAKRTYAAVDLFAEHPFRNGWYGKVNYTWSRSKGNTEGQTLSDLAQTDVAATQTWDFPELMVGAYGLLPNDRTHQIKAYGFYELTPQWSVGGNFLAATGRPKNCLGNNEEVDGDFGYQSAYHMCNGVPSPRGALGKLPADIRLDANVAFKPAQVKGLVFKVDVFNVFNRQAVQTIDETYNSGTNVSPTYNRAISYTAPRSMRLTAEYNHKF